MGSAPVAFMQQTVGWLHKKTTDAEVTRKARADVVGVQAKDKRDLVMSQKRSVAGCDVEEATRKADEEGDEAMRRALAHVNGREPSGQSGDVSAVIQSIESDDDADISELPGHQHHIAPAPATPVGPSPAEQQVFRDASTTSHQM